MNVGDPIPTVTLQRADGTSFEMASLVGRPAVLFLYPRAGTPGCTQEAMDFSALGPAFDAAGIAVFGISKDAPAQLARFADKGGLNVPLLSDAQSDLVEQLGAWVEKSLYGRRSMGVERSTYLFDARGALTRQWRKVRVAGHALEVLETAKAGATS